MTALETLRESFPEPAIVSATADGIGTVEVPLADLTATIAQVRGALDHARFVDLTAVDRLRREDRFELVYLFYSLGARTWLRVKTRTDGQAPSLTPTIPGANWYEREVYDLFGIEFVDHPSLTRIMLPDDWQTFPLRRTESLGAEPVDFTVTRSAYGHD
jgi:NADH:ubiquinone oxidoreductase subunit C